MMSDFSEGGIDFDDQEPGFSPEIPMQSINTCTPITAASTTSRRQLFAHSASLTERNND